MTRFELSINPNYVSHWGIWEALREIMQNIIDRQTESPTSKMFIQYESSNNLLSMGNLKTELSPKTLLLGSSTKTNNNNLIGKFGEGYKLAFLVMVRSGIRISVSTGKSTWEPKIIKSKKFNSEILVIDSTTSKYDENLSISLSGVSPSMYAEFIQNCIRLDYPKNIINTPYGNILLDEKFKRKIFVAGLFVCSMDNEKCAYGYDLLPGNIELDRDRKKVSSFNLYWKTSQMFSTTPHKYATTIHSLQTINAPDIEYIMSFYSQSSPMFTDLCNLSHSEFIKKHGVYAVPVLTTEDATLIKQKFNHLIPVVLPNNHYIQITSSASYNNNLTTKYIENNTSPYLIIKNVLEKNKRYIFGTALKIITEEILQPSINWSNRK